jgi:hypothetical protein
MMPAIGVDSQGFADAEFLHHNETQTVRRAVRLVPMLLEIVERGSFLIRCRPVNARELFRIETPAERSRLRVTDLAGESNRFSDHVIGRQKRVG